MYYICEPILILLLDVTRFEYKAAVKTRQPITFSCPVCKIANGEDDLERDEASFNVDTQHTKPTVIEEEDLITDDGPILSNAVPPADEVQYMVVNGSTQRDRPNLVESSGL